MRKSILFTFIATITFITSCRKSYTCSCTTTVIDTGFPGSTKTFSNDPEPYNKKMTKRNAESACEGQEDAIFTSYLETYKGSGFDIKTSCTLK